MLISSSVSVRAAVQIHRARYQQALSDTALDTNSVRPGFFCLKVDGFVPQDKQPTCELSVNPAHTNSNSNHRYW